MHTYVALIVLSRVLVCIVLVGILEHSRYSRVADLYSPGVDPRPDPTAG